MVVDSLNRPLKDLRISVIDRCNFRCHYCMPAEIFGERYEFLPKKDILSFDEIYRLTKIFVGLGVTKVRITGGEPLLRNNLEELVSQLASIQEVRDLTLTTNGYSLARKALLERYCVDRYFEKLGMTLGQSLLSIHKSYLPVMDKILEKDWLHGISHITGGGLVENTHRVIEENQDIKVNWDSWEWPEIFKMIQKYGEVPIDDMRRSFNLGMGLVAIIDPNSIDKLKNHLGSINEDFTLIGEVV